MLAAALLCLSAPAPSWTHYNDPSTGIGFSMPAESKMKSKLNPLFGTTEHMYLCMSDAKVYMIAFCPLGKYETSVRGMLYNDPSGAKAAKQLAYIMQDLHATMSGTTLSSQNGTLHGWPAYVEALKGTTEPNFIIETALTDRGLVVMLVGGKGDPRSFNVRPFLDQVELPTKK